jgi:hypothetical protein
VQSVSASSYELQNDVAIPECSAVVLRVDAHSTTKSRLQACREEKTILSRLIVENIVLKEVKICVSYSRKQRSAVFSERVVALRTAQELC